MVQLHTKCLLGGSTFVSVEILLGSLHYLLSKLLGTVFTSATFSLFIAPELCFL